MFKLRVAMMNWVPVPVRSFSVPTTASWRSGENAV